MSNRVLITGASGFLGYHIINAAIEKKYEVFAAIRKSSKVEHLKDLSINYLHLDFNNIDELAKLLIDNNIEYIIHAAGTTKAFTEKEYNTVNNNYTYNLAKAAEKSCIIKKFVFVSSLAAIGPAKSYDSKITEQSDANPVTAYGKSKLAAEKQLKQINIPLIVLRPTAIYGPREKDIFTVTQTIKNGLDAYIGNINQKLSFVYAIDMAKLSVDVLNKLNIQGSYNITDGKAYSRYEYADIVKSILGKKAIRLHIPVFVMKGILLLVEAISKVRKKVPTINREKLNELMATNWDCDITKAKKELNFAPQYDLKKGLEETTAWYKQNNWL